jgi:hypothetical protein
MLTLYQFPCVLGKVILHSIINTFSRLELSSGKLSGKLEGEWVELGEGLGEELVSSDKERGSGAVSCTPSVMLSSPSLDIPATAHKMLRTTTATKWPRVSSIAASLLVWILCASGVSR